MWTYKNGYATKQAYRENVGVAPVEENLRETYEQIQRPLYAPARNMRSWLVPLLIDEGKDQKVLGY